MRDPKRIDTVLKEFKAIWKKNPDLRLGQLLCNLGNYTMLYYIEDGQLLEALYKAYGKPEPEVKKASKTK